ncbi:MAG: triose-phosphate isomerase [Chitinivibrionales bacterium]|nr:triose-phosphate isomerase [Chitinivibrionales bacterium]
MARKKFIAGNWKMNTTPAEGIALAREIVTQAKNISDVDIAICPPYTHLAAIGEIIKDSPIKLGAQDVHWEPKGAFTGKISAAMLGAAGVTYVIIGHSEQRTYFHETDVSVNKKIKAALGGGLLPIVCIGETLEERNSGKMEGVLKTQITGGFAGIAKNDALKCTIAYEPVWAIGTGVNASPEQANQAHIFIRSIFSSLYDVQFAQAVRIQYGGSMKPDNAKQLLQQSDVDGGLIGGASLKAADFMGIVIPR